MKLISFPEQNTVFAENQPEYLPLPAYHTHDSRGTIICCWRLSFLERLVLLFTGKVWHTILTFNQSLQPQLLQAYKPLF